jgi:hypothetical protein
MKSLPLAAGSLNQCSGWAAQALPVPAKKLRSISVTDDPATPSQERDMLLSILRGTLGTQRFIYLSGPITTGRRFIEWQRRAGGAIPAEDEWRQRREEAVIKPNCATLFDAAAALRGDGHQAIEPGSFEVGPRKWQQSDYYQLWDGVITAHASQVRFLEGWQFSAGCAFEFLCALRCGRPTLTFAGDPLSKVAALALIDQALSAIGDNDRRIRDLRDDLTGFRKDIEAV